MLEPIDQLHADCLREQMQIRGAFRRLQRNASRWQPAYACPTCEDHGWLADNQDEHPEGRWWHGGDNPDPLMGDVWVTRCPNCSVR